MAVALPGTAGGAVDTPALNAYARARLADQDGALGLAASSYRQALASDPTSPLVAIRSYRQAIESGDMDLALASARLLDAAGTLPRDGTLLLAIDALLRKDWAGARRFSKRLTDEGNFAFLAPIIDSWISLADGPYEPPAISGDGRFAALAQRYADEQLAFQLLTRGRVDDALPVIDRVLAGRTGARIGLRLALAMRLAAAGRRDRALACLPPDMPGLGTARADVAGGMRIAARPMTPAQGVARLLASLSEDISEADARQLALVLARLATFADPDDAGFHVSLARQLLAQDHAEAALLEAAKVPSGSWLAPAAQGVRVDALMAGGRTEEALALARRLAEAPAAGAAERLRLGNILADSGQYDAAAAAYREAAGFYGDGATPWTLYLLEGSALERGGRWDEGKAALEKAAAAAPDEPVVLNYLGYAQVQRRQNVPAALALLEKASRLKPDDPAITDSLGWARYIAGDAQAAVSILERAAAGAPDDMTINEHLGDALWSVGRRYEARYAWSAAANMAEGRDAERLTGKVREGLRPEYAAP